MLKMLSICVIAATLAGCYPERGRAYLACNDQYPRSDAQHALVFFGALGGAASGMVDDPNRQGREACYHDHGID